MEKLGGIIETHEDLLKCYYSGFKIVCIPCAEQPPSLIRAQYTKLHQEIALASATSAGRRKEAGLLLSSEEMECYLQNAFEHFSKDANEPFNFLNTALRNNPIAATFADHITKVATVFSRTKPQPEYGTKVFEHLAPLVASAIFLGATRNRLPHRGTSSRSTPPNTN